MLQKLIFLFFKIYMMVLKFGTWVLNFPQSPTLNGAGSSLKLCDQIAQSGTKNLLVVTDEMLMKIGLLNPMLARLAELGVQTTIYDGIKPDPTIQQIETGLELLKKQQCTAILAIGGGSPIDAAKVIATRAKNNYPIAWMAGLMRVLFSPLPLYVVPTTAGTGSETTIAAVVSDPANTRKFAIMSPKLIPVSAALDGALMTGLPPAITAMTGMDALTHAVEAYISRNALARTDIEALAATQLIMENLPIVMREPSNIEARQKMAEASYKAGVAFTNAGVGYIHAIAHNMGAYYHVPHGLANAIIMPYMLDYSLPNCIDRLAKLAEISGLKTGSESNEILAKLFIARIRQMNKDFNIPDNIAKLKAQDIPEIITKALKEAHWTYAVPRYMDRAMCQTIISQLLVK